MRGPQASNGCGTACGIAVPQDFFERFGIMEENLRVSMLEIKNLKTTIDSVSSKLDKLTNFLIKQNQEEQRRSNENLRNPSNSPGFRVPSVELRIESEGELESDDLAVESEDLESSSLEMGDVDRNLTPKIALEASLTERTRDWLNKTRRPSVEEKRRRPTKGAPPSSSSSSSSRRTLSGGAVDEDDTEPESEQLVVKRGKGRKVEREDSLTVMTAQWLEKRKKEDQCKSVHSGRSRGGSKSDGGSDAEGQAGREGRRREGEELVVEKLSLSGSAVSNKKRISVIIPDIGEEETEGERKQIQESSAHAAECEVEREDSLTDKTEQWLKTTRRRGPEKVERHRSDPIEIPSPAPFSVPPQANKQVERENSLTDKTEQWLKRTQSREKGENQRAREDSSCVHTRRGGEDCTEDIQDDRNVLMQQLLSMRKAVAVGELEDEGVEMVDFIEKRRQQENSNNDQGSRKQEDYAQYQCYAEEREMTFEGEVEERADEGSEGSGSSSSGGAVGHRRYRRSLSSPQPPSCRSSDSSDSNSVPLVSPQQTQGSTQAQKEALSPVPFRVQTSKQTSPGPQAGPHSPSAAVPASQKSSPLEAKCNICSKQFSWARRQVCVKIKHSLQHNS